MGYIGHSPTNAGTFYILDALTMGSGTTYTMQVGGVDVSPSADNLLITLDGVIQHAGDAYTVSGSNIVFASGPGSGVEFYGIIMGQSATVGQGSIGADELKVSGDGTNGQVLVSDGDGTFSWATDTENYLPLAGGTMSGAINLGSQNITNGGTITGTFVGNITGNVTGNTSGTAATVTGAAQSAITSVGTLTGLTVQGSNYTTASIQAGSTTHGAILNLGDSGDIDYGSITQFASSAGEGGRMRFIAGTTETMNLRGASVGIGTSNPGSYDSYYNNLVVYEDGHAGIAIIGNTSSETSLGFGDGTSAATYRGALAYVHTSGSHQDKMFFKTAATNQMVIDSSGKVGIGTISPTNVLELEFDDGTNVYEAGNVADNSASGILITNTGTSVGRGGMLKFASKDGDNMTAIVHTQEGNDSASLRFFTESGGTLAQRLLIDHDGKSTFAGELRVNGGQASIYGAEGSDSILELNSDEADDNADRWQMYVFNTNNYLKWRHYGGGSWVDRFWLSSATDNWALNLIGNSPYGMQITTTASNSSSHDMFKIKRGDGTACFEVFGDGNVYGTNEFISDYGFRSKGTAGAAPTGDDHYNVPIKMVAYRKTVSSTDVTNGYIDFDTDIYRDNIISGITNHFGAAASNNNNIGYNPGYGHSLHFYAGGACRLYFGGDVVQNDKMGVVLFFYGSTG